MRQLVLGVTLAGALGLLQLMAGAQAQAPAAQTPASPPGAAPPAAPRQQTPAPTADPYAGNAAPGTASFPLAAPAGADSKAKDTAPPFATNAGPFDPATWKYGTAFNPPAERGGVESGEAEDAAGRQGDRRDAVRRDRPQHLLRHGQRRLRLHLDRDAARPARLAGGGAHVAHVPDREGRAGRARGLHRRTRDSARARRRRAGAGRADGGHRAGGTRTS